METKPDGPYGGYGHVDDRRRDFDFEHYHRPEMGYVHHPLDYSPFHGRGPRGYRRLDGRIWEDVCERLTQNPILDASEIEVRVEAGLVTLTGCVTSWQARRMAEDETVAVGGVTDLHNELRIKSRHHHL